MGGEDDACGGDRCGVVVIVQIDADGGAAAAMMTLLGKVKKSAPFPAKPE